MDRLGGNPPVKGDPLVMASGEERIESRLRGDGTGYLLFGVKQINQTQRLLGAWDNAHLTEPQRPGLTLTFVLYNKTVIRGSALLGPQCQQSKLLNPRRSWEPLNL